MRSVLSALLENNGQQVDDEAQQLTINSRKHLVTRLRKGCSASISSIQVCQSLCKEMVAY